VVAGNESTTRGGVMTERFGEPAVVDHASEYEQPCSAGTTVAVRPPTATCAGARRSCAEAPTVSPD
jgi:hypothetical protein